jgi:hypothetical protein
MFFMFFGSKITSDYSGSICYHCKTNDTKPGNNKITDSNQMFFEKPMPASLPNTITQAAQG